MSWKRAPLYVRSHDLARWLHERLASMANRPDVGLVGAIGEEARRLVGAIALALTFPAGRRAHRDQADATLVRLRVLLRLAEELGFLSPRQRRYALGELQTLGRMVGGWQRSARRRSRSGVEAPAVPPA